MYLTQTVRRAAQINPGGIATRQGPRSRTWLQVHDRIARLAAALRRLGLQPGDRAAILSLNSDRYLEYYFAVPWAGGVLVPLNNRWSRTEMEYAVADAGPTILFVDDHHAGLGAELAGSSATIRTVIFLGEGTAPPGWLDYEVLIDGHDPVPDVERDPEAIFAIFYTGGTTGFPKGVMLSSRNLWASGMVIVAEMSLRSDDSFLHSAPMFHMADGAWVFALTLAAGTHVFLPAFDVGRVLATVAAERITRLLLVPTMFKMVLDHPDFPRTDWSSLRMIVYGAAPMPEAVLRTAIEVLPRVELIQAYGQTELAPMATTLRPEYHVLEGPAAAKRGSVGQAVQGVDIRITDEHDREVPRGTVGEIRVRGPNAMLGYWNKPTETAATIVGGWVRTGDGGSMDEDGFVYLADRIKDMIISGGENVYSAEVENAIMSHPSVAQCAVIGIPDQKWGEAVHAIVVTKPAATVDGPSLIAHCHALIAGYKCPRSVDLRTDPLPLSGAGKILKRELRKPFWV